MTIQDKANIITVTKTINDYCNRYGIDGTITACIDGNKVTINRHTEYIDSYEYATGTDKQMLKILEALAMGIKSTIFTFKKED